MPTRSVGNKKIKETALSALCISAIFFIALLFSLTARSQPLTSLNPYTDSSVFQYVARVMLNGGMPYRDAFDHKGPLLYCINAFALWISPTKGLWIAELATLFFAFLAMYKVARLFCGKISSVCVVIAILPLLNQYFQGGNLTEEYALPFISGAIYIFTDYFLSKKTTRFCLILCGAFLGFVLMLRVNMIAVWMVMCIGVLLHCIYNHEMKQVLLFLAFFVIGLLTAILPFIIWLASNGALQDFYNDYIVFNFAYTSEAQGSIYSRVYSFMHFFNEPLVIVSFGVLVISVVKKRQQIDIWSLLTLVASLLLTCISGNTLGHYGMVLIPTLIVQLAYIGKACDDSYNKNQLCAVFLAMYLLVSLFLPTWEKLVENSKYSLMNREINNIDPAVLAVSSWVEENTEENEPIIVCGNLDVIYNQSNRFAASRYSYQSPVGYIDSNIEKEFFEELSENKPAAIVLMNDFFAEEKILEFINANNYVEEHIDEAGTLAEFYILN